MGRFIVIDHCLSDVDGHHFEYDARVLKAATQAGYDCVLVTNRRFQPPKTPPLASQIIPIFRYSAYHRYAVFNGEGLHADGVRLAGVKWIRPTADASEPWRLVSQYTQSLRYWWGRRRRVSSFVRSCHRWWKQLRPTSTDIIFFPTITEFDLECLAEFLANCPETINVHWHVQFHFPFLNGWPPDYKQQAVQLNAMRTHFQHTLSRLTQHHVHFYVTCENLRQQYSLLGNPVFEVLPYPIPHAPQRAGPVQPPATRQPLQITCAGAYRPEKGYEFVDIIVSSLWPYFQSNQIQLAIQHSRRAPPLPRPTNLSQAQWEQAVRVLPFPMPHDDYHELIRRTDIGLFMYHAKRYYARVSGVLLEMLAEGIPVIVPAACWLADQVSAEVYAYQDRVIQERLHTADSRFSAKMYGHLPVQYSRKVGVHSARYSATRLTFAAGLPSSDAYLRQTTSELDRHGKVISVRSHIVSPRDDGSPTPILVRLRPDTHVVRLEWSAALGTELKSPCQIDWGTFALAPNESTIPESSVALIAADAWQVTALLEEMIQHYPHYRRTAVEFSRHWRLKHDPQQVIHKLENMQSRCPQRRSTADVAHGPIQQRLRAA